MWFAMLASRSPCKNQFCKTILNESTDFTWQRMAKSWGITEPISSVSLFSHFFRIWETLVTGATLIHKHVFMHLPASLGATTRSYRRQDGADAAARFEKFLPARASLRPPIFLKFTTKKHRGMVHLATKRHTRTFSRFCTIIPEIFAARRR